jgi:hypothetical protein
MDYFFSFQNVLLQYRIMTSDSLTVDYYMFNLACYYVYQLYLRVFNLLNASDFFSSSLLDGGGPGRSKSKYETVLSFICSFNGQQCGDKCLIISRNDKYLEDLPSTLIPCSVLIDLSTFNLTTSFESLYMHLVTSSHAHMLASFYFLCIVSALSASSTSMLV